MIKHRYLMIAALLIVAASGTAWADWQVYWEDKHVIASYDYTSFAPFRDQPSVWVRWHRVTPVNRVMGVKLQLTAKCGEHRIFEIAADTYDVAGEYIESRTDYDAPKEYPITPASLKKATYELLCWPGQ